MLAASAADPPPGGTDTTILLRPMTVADFPLMCRWLGAAHVHRWWHDSFEPAAVSAQYLPCIKGTEPSHPLIAELPSGPIAFVQWYRWADYPDYGQRIGVEPDEAGFDYLIGEQAQCGQGLGTRLIAALIRLIREHDPTVAGFVVDPEQANTASRRVLEKNGFHLVAVKQVDNPDGHPVGPSAIYRYRLTVAEQGDSVGDLGGA
jgi:aminoglycoside 6'-N-acetyltransferase